MLYFIAVWTGLLAVCLTVGCGWLRWLHGDVINRSGDRVMLSIWLGLVVLAISSLAIALFMPLSPLAGIAAILPWLLLALKSPAVRAELSHWASYVSYQLLLGYGLCAGAVAVFISQRVTWLDTGQYHYGFIQWLGEYGIVPGLALLNPQFGFVSAWFALAAPFNATAIDGRASTVMNGFILLVAVLQIAIALSRIALSRALLRDWFSLLFLLAVCILLVKTPLLAVITVSPSPDSAIALLTVAVAWSILVVSAAEIDPARVGMSADLIPLVLSIGAVSIKLTALPLLAIATGFYVFRGIEEKNSLSNSLQRSAIASSLLLLLLMPFLASEVLVSGCPLYPSTAICLDLPWTHSIAATRALAENTYGWGQWFEQPPSSVNRPLWLLQQWFMSNQSSKLITALILASIGSIIHLLTSLRTKKLRISRFYSLFWLAALAIAGTTFMMLKAPLFRFGMGYVLLLPVLSVSVIFHYWTRRRSGHLVMRYLTMPLRKLENSLLFAGVLWAIALNAQSYVGVGDRLLLAPPLPTVEVKVQQSSQITYLISQDSRGQCWSANLPCVSSVRPDVKLRNSTIGLKGGFILVREPES